MTLGDVTLPITDAWGKAHALVFSPQMAARLAELHAVHGSQKCVPAPTTLTDGRLCLSADILIEVVPGGMLIAMWDAADKAVLLPNVDVVPLGSVLPLWPPSPPVPWAMP